ncbi:MAG: SulP family inorganic anion transporter [Planctomyces sp.]|nr:SulP family inorganic anion transporter [Planctomyces sp.]
MPCMFAPTTEIPRGNAAGFRTYFRRDITSGFLVFLIALPLCLGISLASGYPSLAGVFTAIIGAALATALSNSELTIKGPAAGLIVIVLGAVEEFGGRGFMAAGGPTAADWQAYKMALAVTVVAGVLQILFGLFRAGILGEFFPTSTVHGMLAAIGVIIMAKQFPVALGESNKGEPLELLLKFPQFVLEANPAIALIGMTSLAIMFLWPSLRRRLGPIGAIPSQLVVLLVSVPMASAFDLLHQHSYTFWGSTFELSDQFLVKMPERMFGMFAELTAPDFGALALPAAWKWVMLFFLIGSLESMLSAKAVDLLDPWKRKTNLNRDLVAVGIANTTCGLVGGLPMISEIVRSRANIDNGARTRFANMWHGVFLLICVALIPTWLHRVPLAALAAMLVYTGTRLAHPTEFINLYRIGREQLVIFCATIVGVLATDLLIGVGIGIAVKLFIHTINGVPLKSLFKPFLEVEPQDESTCVIRAYRSAVFTNWIPFRRQIEDLGLVQRQNIILDLAQTRYVDHSTMEKLHELQEDFEHEGLRLDIIGLDDHRPMTEHAASARKRVLPRMRRITIVAEARHEDLIRERSLELGTSNLTIIPCYGTSRPLQDDGLGDAERLVRVELVVPSRSAESALMSLRRDLTPACRALVCAEMVEVVNAELFEQPMLRPAAGVIRPAAATAEALETAAV